MDSTVVGSFPLPDTEENFKRVFRDQINSGITIPCYPQLVDMNHQILQPLANILDDLSLQGKEFHLHGDVEFPKKPVATGYGKRVLDILKEEPSLKSRIHGMKACLTGPFTLCSNIIIDDEEMAAGKKPLLFREPRGHLLPELLKKMAAFMARVTEAYKNMGFTIISIDEPFLSQLVGRKKVLFHQKEFVKEIINEAAKNIPEEGSLHVCGTLSPLLRDMLLETNLHYLDHEFETSPKNFDLFSKESLEAHGKVLAFGAIQTNPVPIPGRDVGSYLETHENVVTRLEDAKNQFGEENLIIKPDCGFGGMEAFDRIENGLGYRLAMKKLEIMTGAIETVFG